MSKASEMPEDVSGEAAEPDVSDSQPSRWKRYETKVRERAEAATTVAAARRQDSRFYDTLFRVYERNRLLPASLLVGALASRIVIYLIPLLTLVIFAFGYYVDATDEGLAATSSIAGIFAEAVEDSRDVNEGYRIVALIAMTFATLYAANSLGRLIRRSTALVWQVPYRRPPRPWTTLVGVLALTFVGSIIASLGSWSDNWTWEAVVGAGTIAFILVVLIWLLVGRLLPHDPDANRWSDFAPGAFFFAFGVVGLRIAMLVYFVPQSAGLLDRYGAIGVALVMLTWAYWLGMIVIGGSELNVALFRNSRRRRRGESRQLGS